MIDDAYLAKLPPCEDGCEDGGTPCEMRTALRYLNAKSTAYRTTMQIPPLTPLTETDKPRRFGAFTVRIGRGRGSTSARPTRIDSTLGDGISSSPVGPSASDLSSWTSSEMFKSSLSGVYWITSGKSRSVLDIWLEYVGPELCSLGYSLSPCISDSGVSFIRVRKGRYSWVLVYAETVSGVDTSTLLRHAKSTGALSDSDGVNRGSVLALYIALSTYQSFLLATFGSALCLTAGMTALRSVRHHLHPDFRKWRPTPLLTAMERDGRGYRGGIGYGMRYKGPTWRIDVNRQYTATLAYPLPLRSAFGRYVSPAVTKHGVFLCSVQFPRHVHYPLGIWSGERDGFVLRQTHKGTVLCVLHTAEYAGLENSGAIISPYYGYIFTHSFTLSSYTELLQSCMDKDGRDSPIAQMSKPLGNYVYGKLGQNPEQKELLFQLVIPERSWHPYFDDEGTQWPGVWERSVTRHTSSQHVEIAATITAVARSQTLTMWAFLQALGYEIVRVHTDSLTVNKDPSIALPLNHQTIGGWRMESEDVDTIIVGSNAYIDGDGAHINGVKEPTWAMVERVYDGHVLHVQQDEKTPLRGFARGRRVVDRRYG